jgi:ribosomal-protein-alanine N-acetyltransferase
MTHHADLPVTTDRELETARCRLRYPRLDDVPRFMSAFSSPHFPKGVPLAQLTTDAQVLEWVQGSHNRWDQGQGYTWTAEEKASKTIVGQTSLTRLPSAGSWALAFWTHPDCWGQGYAPETAQRAVRLAFEELAASRVWAAAATWNQASQRVLQKLGMVYVGDNPAGYTLRGKPIPTLEFEITREAWKP